MTARPATRTAAATPSNTHARGRRRSEIRHAQPDTAPPAGTTAPAHPHDGQDSATAREQRIRELAYSRYLQRGGADGHDLDDWLQAEAQVG